MPQVPSQSNIGVLPQPMELPRLNAADFGAGKFQQLASLGEATSGMGEGLTQIGQELSRANARNAFNQYVATFIIFFPDASTRPVSISF